METDRMNERLPQLRHWRALSAAARLGNLSAVSRALHLSQPAVTQAIAAIERHFTQPLLARTSRGVTVTPAGVIVATRVTRALEQLQIGIEESLRGVKPALAEPLRALTSAQVEAVLETVEHGGFGRAARASGVARTTIHRAARQLERSLGIPLFETTSHGVRPTREAERLARRAQLAATEWQQAVAEVAALAGDERGMTVIGAMPLARSVIVPAAVLKFAATHPHHRVAILDGPYDSMLEALRRGRADLLVGAVRSTVAEDVVQEPLFDDPLAIIVRAGHPLAKHSGRAPSRAILARLAWIAPRAESPLHAHFRELFPAGTAFAVEPIECNSLVAARALLLGSDRAMLLSAHQVQYELAAGELLALPHPAGRVVRKIGMTSRRDWRPTAAQEALVAMLRDHARVVAGRAGSPSGVGA
jgi:DNA-binding transcriptional LysR family regulator